jgi:hypothetical protein
MLSNLSTDASATKSITCNLSPAKNTNSLAKGRTTGETTVARRGEPLRRAERRNPCPPGRARPPARPSRSSHPKAARDRSAAVRRTEGRDPAWRDNDYVVEVDNSRQTPQNQ